MSSAPVPSQLLTTLEDLAAEVEAASFELSGQFNENALQNQRELLDQLRGYVLPRLRQVEAPLLVVVGGSTGAGKSTLVNSIVGKHVSESGVLRPTTRTPVLIHHPDDTAWFTSDGALPQIPRTAENERQSYALRQVTSAALTPGLAILDAPDVDSIDQGNRELAEQLLAAADLWLFVTSAARYADQVPWDYLRRAAERSVSVAVVLDRTSKQHVHEVRSHLAKMMSARGLADSPLFTVPEAEVDSEGKLPFEAVGEIAIWLQELAGDASERRKIVAQTLLGAVRHDVFRARDLIEAAHEQIQIAEQLHGEVERIYAQATESVITDTTDGSMLRGEVLARWQEFVGTGEIFRNLEASVGRFRDRIFRRPGRGPQPGKLKDAAKSGLHILVVDHAEQAAEQVAASWANSAAGREILQQYPGLERASRGLHGKAEDLSRQWQAAVFELVSQQGSDKKSRAKLLSAGVNTVGVSLMVVVFAGTGGITGAEVGIAGGTAVVGQKVLEAVFGDQAVRDLARAASNDLQQRLTTLFADEARRFSTVLPDVQELRERTAALEKTTNETDATRLVTDLAVSGESDNEPAETDGPAETDDPAEPVESSSEPPS